VGGGVIGASVALHLAAAGVGTDVGTMVPVILLVGC